MNTHQPKGLYPLFFTELWERFGFYAVQTILVLYMSLGMGLSDNQAFLLYGTFSSMLYLTPVIGGYLADRVFGFKQSIIWGGFLLVIGYAVMAIHSTEAFFYGMSIVVVANGLFKPNVSSMVGDLYRLDDPRRDGGFTIFYMGINIGALLPPLFAGALVNRFGWHWGFLAGSFGLMIGVATFLFYQKSLGRKGEVPAISPLRKYPKRQGFYYSLLIAGILASIGVLRILFMFPRETIFVLIATSIGILLLVLSYLFKERPEQRRKLTACLILILISVGFWAIYIQTYTSLMYFASRNMNPHFLGFTIDAEFTQFFNPFFIILLSPFLSRFWLWLEDRQMNPSTPMKFTLGMLMMAIGFILLGSAVRFFSVDGILSPWWLCCSYFIQTLGELLLSPIGLAMITRLAPHHLVGMMMGVWFLTQSAAFAIGGGLATWASVPASATLLESSMIYSTAFLWFGAISFLLSMVSLSLVPYVKRLISIKNEV